MGMQNLMRPTPSHCAGHRAPSVSEVGQEIREVPGVCEPQVSRGLASDVVSSSCRARRTPAKRDEDAVR